MRSYPSPTDCETNKDEAHRTPKTAGQRSVAIQRRFIGAICKRAICTCIPNVAAVNRAVAMRGGPCKCTLRRGNASAGLLPCGVRDHCTVECCGLFCVYCVRRLADAVVGSDSGGLIAALSFLLNSLSTLLHSRLPDSQQNPAAPDPLPSPQSAPPERVLALYGGHHRALCVCVCTTTAVSQPHQFVVSPPLSLVSFLASGFG